MYLAIITLTIVFIIIIAGYITGIYKLQGGVYSLRRFAHPGAAFLINIYDNVRKKINPWDEEQLEDYYTKVYIGQDREAAKREERLKPALFAIYALLITSLCAIMLALFTTDHKRVDSLTRPEYGSEKITLMTSYRDNEIPVEINVGETVPDMKEMERRVDEAIKELPDKILGANENFKKITDNLQLYKSYKNKSTRITWISSDNKIIDSEGMVNRQNIYEDTPVTLTMQVKSFEVVKEREIDVVVVPDEGLVRDRAYLSEMIDEYLNRNVDKEVVELPSFVDDEEVVFYTPPDNRVRIVIYTGILLSICLAFYGSAKRREKLRKREKELVNDFEEVASKLLLYAECGFGVSKSFERISDDYENRHTKRRYVYEEMKKTCNEIKNGRELGASYEEFGRRCGNIFYIRLGSVLSRQLYRGGDVYSHSIKKEITEARREKQAAIRKKGEEASLKLLAPMGGMFIIVLAIIIIPSFMNM
ncbi:MAG: type II secretion system F family protein [Clostridiales bacterium]|nr:type II secretion system F family protein [Clostridiales bacterium]